MINTSHHEDDDPLIATESLEAIPVPGGKTSDAIQVVIPAIDTNLIFYIHLPEEK